MKNDFDVNEVLRKSPYKNNPEFGKIAEYCAKQLWDDPEEMLNVLNVKFGKPVIIGMRDNTVPVKIFECQNNPIDYGALEQLYTACKLPVAVRGAGMPDLHKGYSLPIGGVVALEGSISPAFVGYDIGCQVHLSMFIDNELSDGIGTYEVKKYLLENVLKSTSFGIGSIGDSDHEIMEDSLWKEIRFLKDHKALAQEQLGSSGGGNHFADIVMIREFIDGAPLKAVGLLTHSGSRGIGNKAGHYYAKLAEQETKSRFRAPSGYGWFDLNSELGAEYYIVMSLLVRYAKANHEIIHERFSNAVGLRNSMHVNCVHNTATVENGMVIHRKGAIPAYIGQAGLIPGSSGSNSYLVTGLGNVDALWSASHGAGRPHSRTDAKKAYIEEDFTAHMKEKGILYHGVAPDETVKAYKNIEDVIESQKKIIKVNAVLRPVVVVMGGSQDDGD